ncbi:hypothetical protein ACHAXR_006640 [Thalassiosira sp. AJA248-18]
MVSSLPPLVRFAIAILPLAILPKFIEAFQLHPSSSSLLLKPTRRNVALRGQANGSRRAFLDDIKTLATCAAAATTTAGLLTNPQPAVAAEDEELIDVYFGCGCFWHVQHEFVEAERRILNRSDDQLTARAGYAGGKAGALDGKVCYHNFNRVSDYGPLGHAEVVSLRIPPSSYKDFALEYTKLFDKNGFRPDQAGDRGTEYRNLVGFPGGAKADVYLKQLVEVSKENGDKLAFAEGMGDDPDRRALAFVMDTNVYPSFVAEQYHQFHDGFAMGEGYPQTYNDIARKLAKAGKLGESDCPNGML